MADLLDIVTSTAVEAVRINGERVVVRGLNGPILASIVSRFPNIRKVLGGHGGDLVTLLFEVAGEAVGPIIAAGVGRSGNKDYEHHAATMLNLENQIDLVTAIVRLSFPNGLTAFLTKVASLSEGTKEKPHKMRLKKLPSALPPLSGVDSHQAMQ